MSEQLSKEQLQAFVEDLVAVYAKHGIRISTSDYYPCPKKIDGWERFVLIDDEGDLLVSDVEVSTTPPWWSGDKPHLAVAPIPTTAHSRLAAAARVEAIRAEQKDGWNTDVAEMAKAVAAFEAELPGWWWSVGMCSVGAHASCAVDGNGPAAHMLDAVKAGHPYDAGFHRDTQRGAPHEALSDVMKQALAYIKEQETSHA